MSDWIRLQKNLYASVKKEVEFHLQPPKSSFKNYEQSFRADQKRWDETSEKELMRALRDADFVLIGDFHTLRQSQRLLLRLLKNKQLQKPDVLGLEALSVSHTRSLEKWLHRPTAANEERLRSDLQPEKRLGSAWSTYREIFLECQRLEIETLALSPASWSGKSLQERDRFAAKRLASCLKRRTWILFGELHCATAHLPTLIHRQFPKAKIVVLQQNLDEVTLKYLPKLQRKPTLVLESSSSRNQSIKLFCLLHTPLWIKWQSFLERQVHGQTEPMLVEDAVEALDPYDQIRWSLTTLLKFLHDPRYPLDRSKDRLLDFHVVGPQPQQLASSIRRLSGLDRRQVERDLEISRTAVVADRRIILLAELTFNACSHAAATYLYRILSKTKPPTSSRIPEQFYSLCLAEAISFFLSKILNHSRRAPSWKAWQNASFGASAKRGQEARAVLKARDFIAHPPLGSGDRWIKGLHPHTLKVSIALSHILADTLFEAFLSGEFSRSRLTRILMTPISSERYAFETLVEFASVGRAFESPRIHLF